MGSNNGIGDWQISLNSNETTLDDYSNNQQTIGVIVPEILGSSDTNYAHGNLDYQGDRDWFAVSLEENYEYSFGLLSGYVYGDSANDLYDPYLRLYDQSGNYLAGNDDRSGSSYESSLTWTATSSGIYYLEAGAYDDSYTGLYTLTSF